MLASVYRGGIQGMRKTGFPILIIVALLLLIIMGGCSPRNQSVFMVGMNLTLEDIPYNQLARSALEAFNKQYPDWKTEFNQTRSDTYYLESIQKALLSGAGYVWSLEPRMAEDIQSIARRNPTRNFIIVDWHPEDPKDYLKNVLYISYLENEGSFLMGLVAGNTTESGVVGFVGGLKDEAGARYEAGFRAGLAYSNPEAKVLVEYIQSRSDNEKAAAAATAMFAAGADVIYHAAGEAGEGVAGVCRENDIWFIGCDRDQSALAPDHTLTGMIKRIELVTSLVNRDLADGFFPGGELLQMGIREGGVSFLRSSFLSIEQIHLLDDVSYHIAAEELWIADNPEESPLFEIRSDEQEQEHDHDH